MVLPGVIGKDTKPEAGIDSKSLAVMGSKYSLLDPQCFALTATLGFILCSLDPSYFTNEENWHLWGSTVEKCVIAEHISTPRVF